MSDEALGEKKKYRFEEGLTNITEILKKLNDETLRQKILEVIAEVIRNDEVMGVRTQIIQAKIENQD